MQQRRFACRGGATIRPRCPFPSGVIKSMIRVVKRSGTVSSLIRLFGLIALILQKGEAPDISSAPRY